VERLVRNVALELPRVRHVHDNVSHHIEAGIPVEPCSAEVGAKKLR
jgi:hypothetical protein